MSVYLLPVFFLIVFFIGLFKRVSVYGAFIDGTKEGLKLVVSVFPYICSMFIAMELFRVSGLSAHLSRLMAPVLNCMGIPSELSELLIIRPLSGNGSLAILNRIFAEHGADSYIARCASVVVGCSETVFYVTGVYFSTSKVKRLRYTVPVSLISCFAGSLIACLICRFM